MPDDTCPDRCTISMDNVKLCGDPVVPDSPIPICIAHAASLLAFMADEFDQAVSSPYGPRVIAMMSSGIVKQHRTATQVREDNAVVYYVRVGELIKIGTTTHLGRRIAAYPPDSTLLATEPGGLAVEAARLEQFAGHLVHGKEWFTPSAELTTHIESLRHPAA